MNNCVPASNHITLKYLYYTFNTDFFHLTISKLIFAASKVNDFKTLTCWRCLILAIYEFDTFKVIFYSHTGYPEEKNVNPKGSSK